MRAAFLLLHNEIQGQLKRIKQVSIEYFRSFYELQKVNLNEDCKNIFIYGENGSGKSSFCKALNLFFESSDKRKKTLQISKFANRHADGAQPKIELLLNNGEVLSLDINGHQGNSDTIVHTRRLKGFLEYKNLLPIYLYNYNRRNNLFRFFVEGPLAKLKNPKTNKLILNEWESNKKNALPSSFYKGVGELSKILEKDINEFLSYFDDSFSIKLKPSKTWTTGVLYLDVVFKDGYIVDNYGAFLNEARLVALAISIYLSVIKKHQREYISDNSEGVNLLILDDVFIGMDLGNRIPLLRLLKERFDDFHIVLTTHDKYWYELSQKVLDASHWKFLEVYSNEMSGGVEYSKVYDIQTSDYLSKARYHFENNDFPACANYQRKAIEGRINELLPENLKYSFTDTGEIKKNGKTNTNYKRLIEYFNKIGIDTTGLVDFTLYSKVILNPLSHDNFGSPIYKREVDSVFKIISEFDKISNTIIRKVSESGNLALTIAIQDENEDWHNYKYRQIDHLRRITQGERVVHNNFRIQKMKYRKNKQEWEVMECEEPRGIYEEFNNLKKKHGFTGDNFAEFFKTNKGITIAEMK